MKNQQLSDRKNLLISKQNSSAGPEPPKPKQVDPNEVKKLNEEIEDL